MTMPESAAKSSTGRSVRFVAGGSRPSMNPPCSERDHVINVCQFCVEVSGRNRSHVVKHEPEFLDRTIGRAFERVRKLRNASLRARS
jgi:hypothetical protein